MSNPIAQQFFKSDKEISDFLHNKFFRCVASFLSWLKPGEFYLFEYNGNDEYEVRSDNNKGQKLNMSQKQLLTCFVPTYVENNPMSAIVYGYWLRQIGLNDTQLNDIINWYDINWDEIN